MNGPAAAAGRNPLTKHCETSAWTRSRVSPDRGHSTDDVPAGFAPDLRGKTRHCQAPQDTRRPLSEYNQRHLVGIKRPAQAMFACTVSFSPAGPHGRHTAPTRRPPNTPCAQLRVHDVADQDLARFCWTVDVCAGIPMWDDVLQDSGIVVPHAYAYLSCSQ